MEEPSRGTMTVAKKAGGTNVTMYRDAGSVVTALRAWDGSWHGFPAMDPTLAAVLEQLYQAWDQMDPTLAAVLEQLYQAWDQAEKLLPPADNVP